MATFTHGSDATRKHEFAEGKTLLWFHRDVSIRNTIIEESALLMSLYLKEKYGFF